MKTKTRKPIAILLTVMIISGMLAITPLTASAIDVSTITQLPDAIRSIPVGGTGTIRLMADIDYNQPINIDNKKITFDLNGYTLNVEPPASSPGYGLNVQNNGEVNLTGAGALNVTGNNGVLAVTGGRATVNNVTATGSLGHGVTLSGSDSRVIVNGDIISKGNSVYITDGQITVNGDIYSDSQGVKADDYSQIIVNGNILAGHTGVEAYLSTITVNGNITVSGSGGCGAQIIGIGSNGQITINGVMTVPAGVPYIRFNGSMDKTKADGVPSASKPEYLEYTDAVNPGSYVWVWNYFCESMTTGIIYKNVGDAVAAVQAGQSDIIRLLADIVHSGQLTVDNKNITFDLNGKTLSIVNPSTSGAGLLVQNNGEVNITDGGALNVSGYRGVHVETGGKATVSNVTGTDGYGRAVSSSGSGSQVTVIGCITASGDGAFAGDGGQVTVNGDINADYYGAYAYESGSQIIVNGKISAKLAGAVAQEYGSITVNGDITVTGSDYAGAVAAEGGQITVNGVMTVPPGAAYIEINGVPKTKEQGVGSALMPDYLEYTDGDGTVWVQQYFFESLNTNIKYETLTQALAAVPSSGTDTIRLLADFNHSGEVTVSNKIITFDLNGKTLNIVNPSTSSGSYGLNVSNNGVVSLTGDGELNVTGFYGVYASGTGKASVTNAISTTSGNGSSGACAINSGEVTVYGDITSADTGATAGGSSQITVHGNITAAARGVSVSGGKVTVYGGITSTGSGYTGVYAVGEGSQVTVNGPITADNVGVTAMSDAQVTVNGYISAKRYGATANTGGQVNVNGNIMVMESGEGVYAYGNGRITINGNVTLASTGTGALADSGGQVTVNGMLTVQGAARYISIQYIYRSKAQGVISTSAPGYIEYTDGVSTVLVEDRSVCHNITSGKWYEYDDFANAITDIPDGGTATLKLLADIDYSGQITVDNKIITFDLNGYTLNVENPSTSGYGLRMYNNGEVNLTDEGALNVSGNGGVYADTGGKATVTNVTATGDTFSLAVHTFASGTLVTVTGSVSSSGYGAHAELRSKIIVNGDIYADVGAWAATNSQITVNGDIQASSSGLVAYNNNTQITVNGNITVTGSGGYGASSGGAQITMNGVMTVPAGVPYIRIGAVYKTKADGVPSASNPEYLEYADAGSTGSIVWVRNYFCESMTTGAKYQYVADAIAAVQTGQSDVIRLLANIDNDGGITVNNKNITFDLNGYTLNIAPSAGGTIALTVIGGQAGQVGHVRILDPSNGELNVIGTSYGIYASVGGKAIVTNAESTGAHCIYAMDSGTEVTVLGDATAAAGYYGANATGGAKITVDGAINTPTGSSYIRVGTTNKAPGDYTTPTTKADYLTYTDGTNTVWVKGDSGPPDPDILYGDVNGDGVVDMYDLSYLAMHLNKYPGYETVGPGADVNGDGNVDMYDLSYLAMHLNKYPGYEKLGP